MSDRYHFGPSQCAWCHLWRTHRKWAGVGRQFCIDCTPIAERVLRGALSIVGGPNEHGTLSLASSGELSHDPRKPMYGGHTDGG